MNKLTDSPATTDSGNTSPLRICAENAAAALIWAALAAAGALYPAVILLQIGQAA